MLVKEGSVKDIYTNDLDFIFKFSNRYSIFDWGKMPDELEGKGHALSFMTWFFFDHLGKASTWEKIDLDKYLFNDLEPLKEALKELKETGLAHHGHGMCDSMGNLLNPLEEELSPYFKVKPVDVLEPKFDLGKWIYKDYEKRPENALVPLEVIFRFGAPKNSSLFKRLDNVDYKREIGLNENVKPGDWFDSPLIEFSTKLETNDRYLSYAEAMRISGMNLNEMKELIAISKLIAIAIKDVFLELNIELWDGKLEYAFLNSQKSNVRSFMLVDSIGPDELRLSLNDSSLSKENLRVFYRDSTWYDNVEKAKVLANLRFSKDWKSICLNELDESPEHLSSEYKEFAESIYMSLVNEIAIKFLNSKVYFKNSKTLDEVTTFFKQV